MNIDIKKVKVIVTIPAENTEEVRIKIIPIIVKILFLIFLIIDNQPQS